MSRNVVETLSVSLTKEEIEKLTKLLDDAGVEPNDRLLVRVREYLGVSIPFLTSIQKPMTRREKYALIWRDQGATYKRIGELIGKMEKINGLSVERARQIVAKAERKRKYQKAA